MLPVSLAGHDSTLDPSVEFLLDQRLALRSRLEPQLLEGTVLEKHTDSGRPLVVSLFPEHVDHLLLDLEGEGLVEATYL